LFPGYVFCRLDPQYRLPILTIPGLIGIVGTRKTPLPVDESEIASIQRVAGAGLGVEPHPFLNHGEKVRLDYGPLAGVEGVYLEGRKQDRIVVSVSLLQRSVAIEIVREWATPVRPGTRPLSLDAVIIS
jgi:transcription antitermination factor NusG